MPHMFITKVNAKENPGINQGGCDPRVPCRGQNGKIRKITFLGSKSAFFGGSLLEPFKWAVWGI